MHCAWNDPIMNMEKKLGGKKWRIRYKRGNMRSPLGRVIYQRAGIRIREIQFTKKRNTVYRLREIQITKGVRCGDQCEEWSIKAEPQSERDRNLFPLLSILHCTALHSASMYIFAVFSLYLHCIFTAFLIHFHCISTKQHRIALCKTHFHCICCNALLGSLVPGKPLSVLLLPVSM